MAKAANITRRAAIVGALASSAALAIPAAAAFSSPKAKALLEWADKYAGRERENLIIEARMMQLARDFYDAAKQIDPSITGSWVCSDTTRRLGPASAVQSVFFERKGAEFAPRRKRA